MLRFPALLCEIDQYAAISKEGALILERGIFKFMCRGFSM
jgi:hypothetical protein